MKLTAVNWMEGNFIKYVFIRKISPFSFDSRYKVCIVCPLTCRNVVEFA